MLKDEEWDIGDRIVLTTLNMASWIVTNSQNTTINTFSVARVNPLNGKKKYRGCPFIAPEDKIEFLVLVALTNFWVYTTI